MKKVAVIGGGISGLTCAYTLSKKNVDVKLFEANNLVGGRIKQFLVGDLPIPLGAFTFSIHYTNVLSLIHEMGLSNRIRKSNKRIGIFTGNRLIKLSPLSILFDGTISLKTKLDLVSLKRYLDSITPDSISEDLFKTSLEDFILRRYSRGVLVDFVEPYVRAFFADTPKAVAAAYGLRVMSAAFITYELEGGLVPLVQGIESRLGDRVIKNAKIELIEVTPQGGFALKRNGLSDNFDIVVSCIPAPELRKITEGISFPEVNYESRAAYIVEGEKKYPVEELVNGDPEYRVDLIHFYGRMAMLSSVQGNPDLTPFFKSTKLLTEHMWPYCAPRMKPGVPQPRYETEIPNLYKSGDYIYGGGLESSSRAGRESAELVLKNIVS